MMHEVEGNLLADDAEALVNTVNTTGVMGKGIALQFRRAYPAMFEAYSREAKAGRLAIGRMHVWESEAFTGPRFVINFPTKRHWRGASRLEDIDVGLTDLIHVIQEREIQSIALPPLGCGNGGLAWKDVAPRIRAAFAPLAATLDVRVYAPVGAPPASKMVTRSPSPTLTPLRAALLSLMSAYHAVAWEWPGLIETQKLAYFLQEAGEPLRLRFTKGRYGPYADELRRTLSDMEGHFISGFGDGSASPLEADSLEVTPQARAHADALIKAAPETAERTAHVLRLVASFGGAYDLELLASVHWAATHAGADGPVAANNAIHDWTSRKAELFSTDDVRTAWDALADGGWIPHFTNA